MMAQENCVEEFSFYRVSCTELHIKDYFCALFRTLRFLLATAPIVC